MAQLLFRFMSAPADGLRPAAVVLPIALIFLAGCERPAQIKRYQVEPIAQPTSTAATADAPPAQEGEPQRMLAVIIPVEDQAWFLKAVGPLAQIGEIEQDFNSIVSELKFESGVPKISLPEGWKQTPGNQFRYGTLVSKDREISVTRLPLSTELEPYLLSNINRWRGQLSLPPLEADRLDDATKKSTVSGFDAYAVDMSGTSSGGGMTGRPPFTSSSAPRPSAPTNETDDSSDGNPTAQQETPNGTNGWKFVAPEGWAAGRSNGFRVAAFEIDSPEGAAEVTLIPLGPRAGSVLENVNRWRQQIELPVIDEAGLNESLQEIKAGSLTGSYIELFSEAADSKAILAAMFPTDTQTIFVKLVGPKPIAKEHAERFRQFVESIRTPDE